MTAPQDAQSTAGWDTAPRLAGTARATLILPAFNEAEALPAVLDDVTAHLGAAPPGSYEVIVVDDGSADGTAAVAARYPCRLIRHEENRGKGAAIRTGLNQASGDLIVVMDADASYPASAVPRIVELLADYDLVRCNRRRDTTTMPWVNRLGNRLFDTLLALAHGLDGSDHLTGLYGLRRQALLTMQLESEGFDIEAEIGIKARVRGLRTYSFPIQYQNRLGEKKLNPWRDGLLILGRIVAMLLLHNPLATFVVPGLVVMAGAIILAAVLSRGPIVTPLFGLNIHSFIVFTLGSLAAFQWVVFGLAAALYGVEAGYRPARWLLLLSARPVRLGAAVAGLGMTAGAAVFIAALAARWLWAGAGLFFDTQNVVLGATLLVLGLQVLSAALFLSIFAGRLEHFQRQSPQAAPPKVNA